MIASTLAHLALLCLLAGLVWLARRRPRQLLLSVVALVATLGVAEVALRQLFPHLGMLRFRALRSRALHHEYPPNREMYAGRFEGEHVTVRTNADGLRSDYTREQFRLAEQRLAILGDSFTFGLGVAQEQAFPTILERRLRDRLGTRDISVLNAGIVSYSPLISDLQFRQRIAHYRPTLVMLFLDATDIGDDLLYERESVGEGDARYFDVVPGKPRYRGALYEVVRPHFKAFRKLLALPYAALHRQFYDYYDFVVQVDGKPEFNRFFIYRHPLEKTRSHFERTLANIDRVAAAAVASGAEFALVVTPRFHHWNPRECPENWEVDAYRLDEPYQFEMFRFFREVAATRDYRVFDLLPAFQRSDAAPLVFRTDPHWNAAGHAFVAATVDAYLQEHAPGGLAADSGN